MIFPLSRKHFTMNFPVEALMPSYLAARLIEYPLLDARSMSLILIQQLITLYRLFLEEPTFLLLSGSSILNSLSSCSVYGSIGQQKLLLIKKCLQSVYSTLSRFDFRDFFRSFFRLPIRTYFRINVRTLFLTKRQTKRHRFLKIRIRESNHCPSSSVNLWPLIIIF